MGREGDDMSADIVVNFQIQPFGSGGEGSFSQKRFTDWYDFADWLKQENENKRMVCIIAWQYAHAQKRE